MSPVQVIIFAKNSAGDVVFLL